MTVMTLACRFTAHYIVSWNDPLEWVEPANVARALAAGKGFANAFGPESGPTAHCSPAYPLLVAAVFRVFDPDSAAGANAQRLFNLLIVGIGCGALVLYANFCRMPRGVTIGAALVIAVLPVNYYSERAAFEAPLVSLALIMVLSIFRWLDGVLRYEDSNYLRAGSAGILCGVAGMVSPLLLMISAVLAIHLLARRGGALWRPLGFGALVTIVVLLPWAVRNRMTLGSWIWTRSNFATELLVSNQDDATPLAYANVRPGGPHGREHPYANKEKYRQIIAVGEVAFQREQGERAWAWIRSHPTAFMRLSVARFALFWFPPMRLFTQSLLLGLETVLGLLGLVLTLRERRPWAQEMAIAVLVYPLAYYVIEVSARYRYPLDALMILLASYGLFGALNVLQGRLQKSGTHLLKEAPVDWASG